MFSAIKSAPAGEWAKWCGCFLILLAPGSFVILPVLWLVRQWATRGPARSRESRQPL